MDEAQEALNAVREEETLNPESVEVPPEEETEEPDAPADETTEEVPTTEEPVVEKPTEDTTVPAEDDLYELPDGRKVTVDVLQKEWKENFLPDYTKKATALKEMERRGIDPYKPNPNSLTEEKTFEHPWEDPEWVPQTYAEILTAAKDSLRVDAERQAKQQQDLLSHASQAAETQLAEVKKLAPDVNENALFQHALKYGFSDLTQAFKNMQDMNIAVKATAEKVAKDIQTRKEDPIATRPGNTSTSSGVEYNPSTTRHLTAQEALALSRNQ